MANKADLFKKAYDLGLVPEDSTKDDYTAKELEALVKGGEQLKDEATEKVAEKVTSVDESLFEKAVRIKAVPIGAKESNYAETHLAELVKRKEATDIAYANQENFKKSLEKKSDKKEE